MGRNPYERVHPKEELSVEINFRSFLAGEGDDFFEPVPVEDMVDFASVGDGCSGRNFFSLPTNQLA